MKAEKKRLGEMLLEAGLIDEMQLNSALGQQRQWGGKLGSVLIQMGFIDECNAATVLEKQLGVKCVSLENMEIPQKALQAVKHEIAKKYCIMPLDLDKNTLSIAIADPTDVKTLDDLSFMLGVRIKPILAFESDIKNAIARHYEGIVHAGKKYKTDLKATIEKMQLINPTTSQTMKEPEEPHEKKEITSKAVIEALISILIEKKIITREELLRKLAEKSKS
jgi:type IV pilus assembly protein PilB